MIKVKGTGDRSTLRMRLAVVSTGKCVGAYIAKAAFAVFIWLAGANMAAANVSDICDSAAHLAARQTGVPVSVLKAITRSETGRNRAGKLQPWPWTVNMEGVGKWFASRDEALSYVRDKYSVGARSFDVGCFQINYKWHGSKFETITEMFDPEANALYAARFLKQLYAEKNDWSAAAGAYHSRTKEYATQYRNRFDRILAAASAPGDLARQGAGSANTRSSLYAPDTPRQNNYPFFQESTQDVRLGSLVPLASGSGTLGSLFAMSGG